MERCLCFTPQSRLGFLWVNKEQWALKGELNALQNCNTAWQILISLKVLYFKASFKGVDFPCAIRVCLACLAQLTNAGCHPALLISLLLSFVLSDKQPVGWGLNFTPAPVVCVCEWMKMLLNVSVLCSRAAVEKQVLHGCYSLVQHLQIAANALGEMIIQA